MSNLIRAVRAPWTPQPQTSSSDASTLSAPDTYRFLSNQIESAQRQNQSAVSRTIRAGNINSAPRATDIARPIASGSFPTTIIALLVK